MTKHRVQLKQAYGRRHVGLVATERIETGDTISSEIPLFEISASVDPKNVTDIHDHFVDALKELSPIERDCFKHHCFRYTGSEANVLTRNSDLFLDYPVLQATAFMIKAFLAFSEPFAEEVHTEQHRLYLLSHI